MEPQQGSARPSGSNEAPQATIAAIMRHRSVLVWYRVMVQGNMHDGRQGCICHASARSQTTSSWAVLCIDAVCAAAGAHGATQRIVNLPRAWPHESTTNSSSHMHYMTTTRHTTPAKCHTLHSAGRGTSATICMMHTSSYLAVPRQPLRLL